MQEYEVKRGLAKKTDLRTLFSQQFGSAKEEGGWLVGGFGAMPVIKAKYDKDAHRRHDEQDGPCRSGGQGRQVRVAGDARHAEALERFPSRRDGSIAARFSSAHRPHEDKLPPVRAEVAGGISGSRQESL